MWSTASGEAARIPLLRRSTVLSCPTCCNLMRIRIYRRQAHRALAYPRLAAYRYYNAPARQKGGICGQLGKPLARFDQFYRCIAVPTKTTAHEEGRLLLVAIYAASKVRCLWKSSIVSVCTYQTLQAHGASAYPRLLILECARQESGICSRLGEPLAIGLISYIGASPFQQTKPRAIIGRQVSPGGYVDYIYSAESPLVEDLRSERIISDCTYRR